MSSVIHMDPQSCEAVQGQITSTKEQLMEQLSALGSVVDGMIGSSWIAPGATQFQNDFQSWRSSMTSTVEQLNEFASALAAEIARFVSESSSYR